MSSLVEKIPANYGKLPPHLNNDTPGDNMYENENIRNYEA